MRTFLIVVHASAGIAGLGTGLLSIPPPHPGDRRNVIRGAYLACVAVLLVSLVALVVIDWDGLDSSARIAFSALTVLAAMMVFRLVRAYRAVVSGDIRWQERYINHVYFTYISLWMGFVILPALSLPLPQVTVPLVGVGVLLMGHLLLARYKARLLG